MVEIYKIKNCLNSPNIDFMFENRNNTLKFLRFCDEKKKNCKNGS